MKKLIICILLLINNGLMAFPQGTSFTYQGKLSEAGQLANGVYTFNVYFYDSPTNGNLIDSNLNLPTLVDNGLFNLELDISDGPFQGNEVWIELELEIIVRGVGTNQTLSPRQLISNAPYAIQSKYVGEGGVSTLSINNDAVTSSKLAVGSVTNSKLAVNSVNSSNIINETIDTDDIKNGSISAVDVNSASIQERITGTCAAGSSIRSISENGMVTCEPDSVGSGSGWELTGNSGTNPAVNFIGTTDNQPLIAKVNNKQVLKVQEATGQIAGSNHMNVILGSAGGTIDQFAGSKLENSAIIGGKNNAILTLDALGNIEHSAVFAGTGNFIKGASESVIIGGANSSIDNSAYRSIIVSGTGSRVSSNYSFASGFGSTITHHGSWVWNDLSSSDTTNSFATTSENQFLIRAEGGFGLGLNAPASPMHVKGKGKTFGALTDEVVLTVDPKISTDDVSLAINRLDSTKESALAFTTSQSPDFDIRSVNGSALDFNSYESGSASFMMRINDSTTNRIDFNANIEPQVDNSYDFGSASYRWASIHAINVESTGNVNTSVVNATTLVNSPIVTAATQVDTTTLNTTNINSVNPVNVTSDKRLKQNISELQYGLSEILSLKPVSYQLVNSKDNKYHLGLIAQDVENIIPEIVNIANDESQTRSMRYAEIVPVLIKATQEQQDLIDQQNHQIKELKILVQHLINEKSK